MKEDAVSAPLEALMDGFVHEKKACRCLLCGKRFEKGEIFPMDGRFFDAEAAARHHLKGEHGGMLAALLDMEGRYNPFTDRQKELLRFIAAGLPDAEIAARTCTALSTVRHQKFVFREKMKQAKLLLAACELAFAAKEPAEDQILPPHGGAIMVDDRYLITEAEREKIIAGAFSSLEPLKLRAFPPKEKKKVVVLREIAQRLTPGKRYTEPELNDYLSSIFDDYVTIRRYLIEYGFMQRTRDCAESWLTEA